MGLFDKLKNQSAIDRMVEEQLYEQVATELRNGIKRDGLWLKSLEKSNGNEVKAKSIYIKYRIQSLIDEANITHERNLESQAKEYQEAMAHINNYISLLKSNGYTVNDTTKGWLITERIDGSTLIPKETSIGTIDELAEFTKINCK